MSCLRKYHHDQGLCEEINPSQRPLAGLSTHKVQDKGDGSYSNTTLSAIFRRAVLTALLFKWGKIFG